MWDRFLCFIFYHEYTCDAEQGVKPTQAQLDGGVKGFLSYARMYCSRCGHTYKGDTHANSKK